MDIHNKSIAKARKYLKHSILRRDKAVVGFQNERKEVMDLLQRTIQFGESNSILLIGPRSVGKTWVQLQFNANEGDHINCNNFVLVN